MHVTVPGTVPGMFYELNKYYCCHHHEPTYSFEKYLLSAYYGTGTVGYSDETQKDSFCLQGTSTGAQTVN